MSLMVSSSARRSSGSTSSPSPAARDFASSDTCNGRGRHGRGGLAARAGGRGRSGSGRFRAGTTTGHGPSRSPSRPILGSQTSGCPRASDGTRSCAGLASPAPVGEESGTYQYQYPLIPLNYLLLCSCLPIGSRAKVRSAGQPGRFVAVSARRRKVRWRRGVDPAEIPGAPDDARLDLAWDVDGVGRIGSGWVGVGRDGVPLGTRVVWGPGVWPAELYASPRRCSPALSRSPSDVRATLRTRRCTSRSRLRIPS